MISFLAQPNTIEPSYSNLVFQFLSTGATDSSKYKYRYVVDVYIQEGSDEQDGQVAQLKITPSSEGWGQVDISPILRNYTHSKPINAGCSGNTTPLHSSAWGYLDSNMIVYSIKVGEEYASSANGTIFTYDGKGEIGEPDVRSNVNYAYNGVKEWFNGKNYNFEPYYLTGDTAFSSGVCRFMTNSPRTRYIRTGDYSTLAALNYMDTTTDLNSREIYSALFTFYDNNDSVISTGRTYNVYDLCGTRPNCSYYDGYWETPTNWAEQQVVYLGVGVPNIEEHGISFPSNTQYYKVQLEGTLSTPEPPTPTIDTFSGCSCYDYQVENVSSESQVSIDYLDCFGVSQNIVLNPGTIASFCACQNTISITGLRDDYILTQLLDCDYCNCRTFRIQNPDPDFSLSYTGYSCSGGTISGSVPPDDEVYICACEDSVASADGLIITDTNACPIPFSADCRDVAVSHTGSTTQTLTYTGCCGTEQTISVPPAVSATGIKMNYPFPTTPGWTITDFGSTTPGDCPPEPVPPSATTFGTGDNIIAQNVCDDTLMYFSYTGDTLEVGKFVNYENTAYEILAVGGGGFVPLNYPYVFDNEEDALAAFPCPTTSTGLCLDTTFISEPFYFYLDGICSAGDRVVYFMNKFGTWDSYNFRAKEDTGYGIEKQEYKSAPELYSEGWDNSSYSGWNAKRNVWNQQVNKSGILFTDYMPQSETTWLTEELFQSPSVYLVGDDGVLEPITITNTEVIVPNYQVGSSKYQIQMEYKSGYNTIRQNHE